MRAGGVVTPRRVHVGAGRHPVVTVDAATGDLARIVAVAAAMAPFPRGPNTNYPGVRRVIDEGDVAAFGYVRSLLDAMAPFIAGGFDCDGFDLLEASFSIVTTPPDRLIPAQRAPHFDSTDPCYLAVMHYLGDWPAAGTAFFRQRSTGVETVTQANIDAFVAAARRDAAGASGYIQGADGAYEEIGRVSGKADRVVIYQGALLHSGLIPPDLPLDADPRRGRLTANLFIKVR